MRIITGYQNTKKKDLDFAITPYLFWVHAKVEKIRTYGIGICWMYGAFFIGIGFNLPKNFPIFYIINSKKQK